MRLTKIIATIGPASSAPETIEELLIAGVDIVRLNFSHGEHETLASVVASVRDLSKKLNKPVAILADLQGPKFRIGELKNHQPITLEKGKSLQFSAGDEPGDEAHLTANIHHLIGELTVGQRVLLNDGAIELEVTQCLNDKAVMCEVVQGGQLTEKKGINVPGIKVKHIPSMTKKDMDDALFALKHHVDYMALSFVRSHTDIDYLRQFLQANIGNEQVLPHIVAKIEKPQALEDIDAIIEAADGIMVARGDLGVELPPERVPLVQKMLIDKANLAGKPVITATQILESMIEEARPTRAEVSDVANAVFDGCDALMLSGETAVGHDPVSTVRTMATIIKEAETRFTKWGADQAEETGVQAFHQAIAQSAVIAARKADVRAIVVMSYSGSMAARISKRKPIRPIIALTPEERVYRLMALLWGVYPLLIEPGSSTEETLYNAEVAIEGSGLLEKDDPIVFCAGKTNLTGMTNTIKIYPFGTVQQQYQSFVSREQQPQNA